MDNHTTWWGGCGRGQEVNFGVDPGFSSFFLEQCENIFFHIFVDISVNESRSLMRTISQVSGTNIHEGESFGADPKKNSDVVNLNRVSHGDCSAFANVYGLPSVILVFVCDAA